MKLFSSTQLKLKKAFSSIEVLLAISLLSILILALAGSLFFGYKNTSESGHRMKAVLLADEGLEAVRNIRDSNFSNIATNGTYGLVYSSGRWILSSSPAFDTTENFFVRNITISTVDANTKEITSTVSWGGSNQTVSVKQYLANWQRVVPINTKKGILVFGDGGTTVDTIRYRLFDVSTNTWESIQTAADVDAATTNKALRGAEIYASSTRNERILLTKHYDGNNHYIYAQIYNGTVWGNVQLLASNNSNNAIDLHNFSGTYLSNGNFVATYSDNSTAPKYRIWNGTSWSAQSALPTITNPPTIIITKARPGTNEVMAAIFDQNRTAYTAYFNGSTWTLHTTHSTQAPTTNKKFIDFDWSTNSPTKGVLIFSNSNTDLAMNTKIWTADGAGSGSWTVTNVNTTSQTSRLGAIDVLTRVGADGFIACDKDAGVIPSVFCFTGTFTPTWSNPTNQTITTFSDTGIQQSFNLMNESLTGSSAIIVYSDSTVVPRIKIYNYSTNTWSLSPINITNLSGILQTVEIIPKPGSDDMMILLADTNQQLYSIVWDGTNNVLYATPTGNTLTSHGTNGSNDLDIWYDFAWDLYN